MTSRCGNCPAVGLLITKGSSTALLGLNDGGGSGDNVEVYTIVLSFSDSLGTRIPELS